MGAYEALPYFAYDRAGEWAAILPNFGLEGTSWSALLNELQGASRD